MQSPFASRATPAICTFRLARSMKKSTRNLVKPLRVQASMVKKSAATIISRCRDRNSPPGGLPLTLRRRFQALLPQNVGDRAPSDFVAQIGQRSLNSPVAPIAVLRGHADYQPLNLVWGAWSAEASPLAALIFPGDQPAVPGQQRCRCHNRGQIMEHPPAQFLGPDGQAAALVVVKAQPLASQSFTQDPVL